MKMAKVKEKAKGRQKAGKLKDVWKEKDGPAETQKTGAKEKPHCKDRGRKGTLPEIHF